MFFILLCVRVHVVFSKVNGLLLGLFLVVGMVVLFTVIYWLTFKNWGIIDSNIISVSGVHIIWFSYALHNDHHNKSS